jgi:hypothetical protein
VSDGYCIKPGYVARARPEYYVDESTAKTWQPDVYATARRIAGDLGLDRVVDVGCGSGEKLVAMHPDHEIIGLDYGVNLEACREEYEFGRWVDHDLESEGPLPLGEEDLSSSVLVCADVIEHLVAPERLLFKLRSALDYASALVLSTPERELLWGEDHLGPPPNPCHVREWSRPELGALLKREGFEHGELHLTRSNDVDNDMRTIMAVIGRDGETADAANWIAEDVAQLVLSSCALPLPTISQNVGRIGTW